MGFKLPNGSDLSVEQLSIINLPTSKDYVITGAPGTGKTVMAIYRAGQMARTQKVLLLVYNRPLMQFLSSALKSQYYKNCVASTYHQWLSDFYRDEFGKSYPQIDRYEPDWKKIECDCRYVTPRYAHTVIDEAQDFPIELITLLKKLSHNITCFIDPNQAIEAGKTSVINAIKKLCVESPYSLTRNFRNTKEIRDVSTIFCKTGRPAMATTRYKKPCLIKCDDYEDQTYEMAEIIRNNKGKSIGIIVNNKNLMSTYNDLCDELEGESVKIQVYKTKTDHEINFDATGVKIVSYGTMKGLEFDLVLLPRFEKVRSTDDSVADNNRIYVALSRPLRELYIFYFDDYISDKWIDTFGPINKNRSMFEWK